MLYRRIDVAEDERAAPCGIGESRPTHWNCCEDDLALLQPLQAQDVTRKVAIAHQMACRWNAMTYGHQSQL